MPVKRQLRGASNSRGGQFAPAGRPRQPDPPEPLTLQPRQDTLDYQYGDHKETRLPDGTTESAGAIRYSFPPIEVTGTSGDNQNYRAPDGVCRSAMSEQAPARAGAEAT